MRAQWVCSRERRLALDKRSSINYLRVRSGASHWGGCMVLITTSCLSPITPNLTFPPGQEKRVEVYSYDSMVRSGASHWEGCMVWPYYILPVSSYYPERRVPTFKPTEPNQHQHPPSNQENHTREPHREPHPPSNQENHTHLQTKRTTPAHPTATFKPTPPHQHPHPPSNQQSHTSTHFQTNRTTPGTTPVPIPTFKPTKPHHHFQPPSKQQC